MVFVAHAGLDKVIPGRLGVNVFFILSGYLITTLMIRERAKTGFLSLKLFYARRSLRIFPPMYAIMAVTLLYLLMVHHLHGITIAGVCSQAFYYQNYYFHGGRGLIPGLGVLWSLAVEEHFYLLFPPLMVLFLDKLQMSYRRIATTLLWICCAILAWRCFVVFTFPNGLEWARDTTDCRADSILMGCALACFEQESEIRHILNRRRLERLFLPCSMVILLITLLFRSPVFRETARYTLQGVALAPVLFYVIHMPKTWMGRVLNTRWLGRLGVLSYSLYLLHDTVLLEIGQVVPSKLVTAILSLGLSIILAYLVHLGIERPTERLRKRYRHGSDLAKQPYQAKSKQSVLVGAMSVEQQ